MREMIVEGFHAAQAAAEATMSALLKTRRQS
jgi:hypothetical protein